MSGSATVFEDGSILSRVDTAVERLERGLALISGLAIFVLMFMAVYSVVGRKFFASPMPGYVDWIEQIMPLVAVMGIAWVQRNGGHIRMDLLIGKLHGRILWAAEFLSIVLILVLVLALLWGSWAHFERSFDFNAPLWSRDSSIDIGLPIWPAKLMVPVAFALLAVRLLLQMWAYGAAFVTNAERPVAVPLAQSIEEQAAAEAEQLQGRD